LQKLINDFSTNSTDRKSTKINAMFEKVASINSYLQIKNNRKKNNKNNTN